MSPWSDVHEGPALLAEGFHLIGDLVIGFSRGRVGIEHGKRLPGIRLGDDIRIERDPPEKGHAHVQGRGLSTAFAEQFDELMKVRTFEDAYVIVVYVYRHD